MVDLVFKVLVAIIFWSCGQTNNYFPVPATSADTTIRVGNSPGSVEAADFNNDTFIDLAITSETGSSVSILPGNGKGGFKTTNNSPFFAGSIPNDICIADFNKDGHLDLGFPNHERKYITVLVGDGKGNFTPIKNSPFATEGIPHVHGITAGDFNGDGWVDLVTDSWGNDQVEVLYGDSSLSFGRQRRFLKVGKRPYQRLRAGDLNGDGIADIVTTNTESNNATILLADGKAGFSEPAGSPFACGDNPFGLAINDLNADGKNDLAIINSPSSMAEGKGKDGLTILINNGTGNFSMLAGSPFYAGQNPSRITTGDVNGDGINDIVSSDYEGNKIYLYIMNKDRRLPGQAITSGRHPKGIAIADFNRDGRGDIAVCNNGEHTVSILLSK